MSSPTLSEREVLNYNPENDLLEYFETLVGIDLEQDGTAAAAAPATGPAPPAVVVVVVPVPAAIIRRKYSDNRNSKRKDATIARKKEAFDNGYRSYAFKIAQKRSEDRRQPNYVSPSNLSKLRRDHSKRPEETASTKEIRKSHKLNKVLIAQKEKHLELISDLRKELFQATTFETPEKEYLALTKHSQQTIVAWLKGNAGMSEETIEEVLANHGPVRLLAQYCMFRVLDNEASQLRLKSPTIRRDYMLSEMYELLCDFHDGAFADAIETACNRIEKKVGCLSKFKVVRALNSQSRVSLNQSGVQIMTDLAGADRNNSASTISRTEKAIATQMMVDLNQPTMVNLPGSPLVLATPTELAIAAVPPTRYFTTDIELEISFLAALPDVEDAFSVPLEVVEKYIIDTVDDAAYHRGSLIRLKPEAKESVEIKILSFGLSVDGGEMTAKSNGFIVSTLNCQEPLLLAKLYGNYEQEHVKPEFGPYAGVHAMMCCFIVGIGIGADDFDMAERLARISWAFAHAANRENVYWVRPSTNRVYQLRFSFQDDKKQLICMTCIGGGSANTYFFCCSTDINIDWKGLQALVCCPRCMAHNKKIDNAWTLTSHLKKVWPLRSKALAAGIKRVMPDLFEGVSSMATDPKRTRINEVRLELLETAIDDELVLRNCHHYETLTESYRAHIRSWPEDDPRLRFAFQGTRLSDCQEQQTRIIAIVLGLSVAEVEQQYKTATSIKRIYREQMALYNVNGRDLFFDEDDGNEDNLADLLNVAGSTKKKPKRVLRSVKVAKMLLCHSVITTTDVVDALKLGIQWQIIDGAVYKRASSQQKSEILLHFLIFFSNRVMYCRKPYKDGRTPLLTQFDRAPPCNLHGIGLRIPENVLTTFIQHMQDMGGLSSTEKSDIVGVLRQMINQTLGSNHAVPVTVIAGKVETVSMTAVKMMKVTEVFPALVDIAFDLAASFGVNDVSGRTLWSDLATGLLCLSTASLYKFDMTEAQIDRFSVYCDQFGEDFRLVKGGDHETNYIANVTGGVLTDALSVFGNLAKVSNIAIEHQIGCLRSHIFGRMHLNPEMAIPELLRHVMILRALQHELLGRRSLEETHELGNVKVNAERRVKDNAAKVKKLAQERGVSTPSPGTVSTRAYYMATGPGGKRFRVNLAEGEVPPPKTPKTTKEDIVAYSQSQNSSLYLRVQAHKQKQKQKQPLPMSQQLEDVVVDHLFK